MQTDYENLPGLHHIPDDDDNKPAQIPLASGEERTASSHRGEEQTSSERLFHPLLHNVMVSKIVAFAACDIAVAHRTVCVTKQWETWIGNAPEKAALLFPAAMGYVLHRAISHNVPSLISFLDIIMTNAGRTMLWPAIDLAPIDHLHKRNRTTLSDRRRAWRSEIDGDDDRHDPYRWRGVRHIFSIFDSDTGSRWAKVSALEFAVRKDHLSCVEKLLSALARDQELEGGKRGGNSNSSAVLTTNERCFLIGTALKLAADHGQTEVVKLFLRQQHEGEMMGKRRGVLLAHDDLRDAATLAYKFDHFEIADLICKDQGWDEKCALKCRSCCPSCCFYCSCESGLPWLDPVEEMRQEAELDSFRDRRSVCAKISAGGCGLLLLVTVFLALYVAGTVLAAQGTTCCVPAACIKEGKNISGSIAPSSNFFASEDFSSSFWQTTTNGGLCSLNPEAAALASTSCTAAFKTLRNSCPSSSLVIEGGTCDAQSSGSIRTFLVVGSAFGLVPTGLLFLTWVGVVCCDAGCRDVQVCCGLVVSCVSFIVSLSVLAAGVAKTNSLGGGPVAGSKSHIYVHADAPFDSLDAGGTCSEVASLLRVDILAPHARNLAIAGVTFSSFWAIFPAVFVCWALTQLGKGWK